MKARRKFRESKSHAIVWVILLAAIAVVFLLFRGATSVYAVYNSWISDLPQLNSEAFNYAEDSYMYAADGTTLLAKFQLEKRDPVELSEVSSYAIKGTIDIEDVRFYEHNGVDPQGIVRALVNNLTGGALEGASTITQQAQVYHQDAAYAGAINVLTTILCIVTMPLMIWLYQL